MSLLSKAKQKYDGWKIKTSRAPRGRTALPSERFTGNVSGNVGTAILEGQTLLTVQHFNASGEEVVENRREIHNRVITNAGRDAIVDAFTGAFTLSNFNYHHCGTGVGNEAVGDTALGTPVSEARATGTQTQPSSDVYQSVGAITFGNAYAVTEHGLFSAAAAGTLLDRTKFAAINVVSGDSIQFTFQITFASGG